MQKEQYLFIECLVTGFAKRLTVKRTASNERYDTALTFNFIRFSFYRFEKYAKEKNWPIHIDFVSRNLVSKNFVQGIFFQHMLCR